MNTLFNLHRKGVLRVVGLMSGTSADGIDAAMVEVPRTGDVRVVAFATSPYPPKAREAVLALCRPDARADELCAWNFALGELFAAAVLKLAKQAGVPLSSIDLIGSHGQTVRHEPQGRRLAGMANRAVAGRKRNNPADNACCEISSTLQIGEPSVIAERTGVPVVADFRPRDIAAGGQGAPLVPYVDFRLFAHRKLSRTAQNIGGIANVTYIPAGAKPADVLAFDTGPGNMILDRLVERLTAGKETFDRDGRLAARGRVASKLLAKLMRHPYLKRQPPKTTGREEFGWAFADALLSDATRSKITAADLLATATAFTAASIADAYRRFLPGPPDEVILSGGGARNPTLVAMLTDCLAPARVRISDELGIDADAKEAIAFAILAADAARGRPNNLPSATGAKRAVVVGKFVP